MLAHAHARIAVSSTEYDVWVELPLDLESVFKTDVF